jgi:hypothetical protein
MTVGLVLGGGGARGNFQVGVVRYLYQRNFRPSVIAGTSVGAINAIKLAEGGGDGNDARRRKGTTSSRVSFSPSNKRSILRTAATLSSSRPTYNKFMSSLFYKRKVLFMKKRFLIVTVLLSLFTSTILVADIHTANAARPDSCVVSGHTYCPPPAR